MIDPSGSLTREKGPREETTLQNQAQTLTVVRAILCAQYCVQCEDGLSGTFQARKKDFLP